MSFSTWISSSISNHSTIANLVARGTTERTGVNARSILTKREDGIKITSTGVSDSDPRPPASLVLHRTEGMRSSPHSKSNQSDEDGRENGKNGRKNRHPNPGFQRASLLCEPSTPSTIMATVEPVRTESLHQPFTDAVTVRSVETTPASRAEDASQGSSRLRRLGQRVRLALVPDQKQRSWKVSPANLKQRVQAAFECTT